MPGRSDGSERPAVLDRSGVLERQDAFGRPGLGRSDVLDLDDAAAADQSGPDTDPGPGTGPATSALRLRREPLGPPTRSQAIIDLSARKRPRSPYSS